MIRVRQQPHCFDCKCALADLKETIEILVEGIRRLVCANCYERRIGERRAGT